jgi:hypothetical protein
MCLLDECILDPRVLCTSVKTIVVPIVQRQLQQHPVPSDVHLEQFDVLEYIQCSCRVFERSSKEGDISVYSYDVVGLWYLVMVCIYIQDDEREVLHVWFGGDPRYTVICQLVTTTLQAYLEGQVIPVSSPALPITSITRLVEHVLQQYLLLT